MKKLDMNMKIGIIALAVFVLFLIVFSVLSSLVQNGAIPDFASNPSIQGVLVFVTFLPLIVAMFFWGKYFKSKNSKIGVILNFVSIALFILGVLQALLSLLGVYSS